MGTWWNGSHEIDVVARDGATTTLVGSCKWTNAPVGLGDLTALQQTLTDVAAQLRPAADCRFALFSREGFTPELIALVPQPEQRLLLFTPEGLFAP